MAPETTKVVPLTCHGHSRPVTHIAFSALTDNDQYYLISACKDNNPMLRDGTTGDWIGTFIGHKGAVWQARLSADAKFAATGSADFTAKVWDTHTGECLHTLQHNHIVRAVAFPSSPSPSLLATGGMEKKLRVWDLARASQSSSASASSTPQPNGANTSTSSNTPTTTATNGTTTPNPIPPSKPTDASYEVGTGVHANTIKSILWSALDSNILITACDDRAVRWWDLRTPAAPIGTFTTAGPIGSCEFSASAGSSGDSFSFSNSNSNPNAPSTSEPTILSIAASKSVHFFTSPTRPASFSTPTKSHTLPHEASSVAASPSGDRFVTGGGGDTWVRLWEMESGEEVEVGKGHHGPVWSVGFAPDGGLFGSGSEDGTVKLWKCRAGGYGLWR